MLSGVMRGVRSLLVKLAPSSIEAELENPRRRAAGGMQLGPFRYKTLWDLYGENYGDFAEDEKQAFALIFGPEFAHAYGELAGEAIPAGVAGPDSAFGQPRAASAGAFGQQPPPPPLAQQPIQPRNAGNSGQYGAAQPPAPQAPSPRPGTAQPGPAPVPPPPWAGPPKR
jgi:hypothetical protein